MATKLNRAFRTKYSSRRKYTLSAVLSKDSFNYILLDAKGVIVGSEAIGYDDIQSLESGLDKAVFNEVNLSNCTIASVLAPLNFIPKKQFTPKKITSYFKLIYPDENLKLFHLQSIALKRQNMIVAFGVEKSIEALFKKRFAKHKFSHLAVASCNYMKKQKKDAVLVLIQDSYMTVACHRNGKSFFFNKFDCFGDTDYLYYLSLVFEVLELNPHAESMYIGGIINASIQKLLESYFKKPKVLPDFNKYAKKAPQKGHHYAAQYMVELCG